MPVQRLRDLAAQKCVQNVALLHDVGDTPFHILRPILCRMSARQLDSIESKSCQIVPYSDQLWPNLIARDFPNRPLASRPLIDTPMPHKALYFKYLAEREALQRDSAQRLRSMTQRLRQEKSKNAITPVKHLLRDPTIRRRPVSTSWSKSSQSLSSLSIVQRARRETRERSRLFQKNVPKDPFARYSVRQPVRSAAGATASAAAAATTTTTTTTHAPAAHAPVKTTQTSANAPPPTPKNISPEPTQEQTTSPRKRRPPSIFLSRPKKQSRPPPKTERHTAKPNSEPSEVQAIRSTIFNK